MNEPERVAHVVGAGETPVATHPRLRVEEGVAEAYRTVPTLGHVTEAHVALDPVMQFFRYDHLPERLQRISAIYAEAAIRTVERVPRNPERTVALRDLLRAKDAAVRAALYQDPGK